MWETPHRIAAKSSAGRPPSQEDAHFACPIAGGAVLAVADGMGGHAAGEIASGLAIRALEAAVRRLKQSDDPVQALQTAAREANQAILKYAARHPEAQGLGTTVVAAIIRHNRLVVGHAGDSRAWLITGGDVRLLTRDHSAVQDAIDRGEIDAEQAGRSPYRNAILRNLGDAAYPGLEISSPAGGWVLSPGSVVLLSSDGAHGFLTETDLMDRLSSTPDLETGLDHLLRLAYARGSDDNITLAGCEIGTLPRSKHMAVPPPPIPERAAVRGAHRSVLSWGARRMQAAAVALVTLILVGLALQLARELKPQWIPHLFRREGPRSLAPAAGPTERVWVPPVRPETVATGTGEQPVLGRQRSWTSTPPQSDTRHRPWPSETREADPPAVHAPDSGADQTNRSTRPIEASRAERPTESGGNDMPPIGPPPPDTTGTPREAGSR